jgi:hypothetical protein
VASAALQLRYAGMASVSTAPGYGVTAYTFQLRNAGPLDAADVQVTGVSLLVAAGSPQTASEEPAAFLSPGGTTPTLQLGTLRAGQSKGVTVLCGATPGTTCAGSEVRVRTRSGNAVAAHSPGFF